MNGGPTEPFISACCTGNGARGSLYVWENTITCDAGHDMNPTRAFGAPLYRGSLHMLVDLLRMAVVQTRRRAAAYPASRPWFAARCGYVRCSGTQDCRMEQAGAGSAARYANKLRFFRQTGGVGWK
jgi:hypothetical protein